MIDALVIFAAAFIAALAYNYLFKRFSDQTSLKDFKQRADKLTKEMKVARKEKNLERMEQIMKQLNQLQMDRMKKTMGPNLKSSLIYWFAFAWLSATYKTTVIQLPFPLPIPHLSWAAPIIITTTLGWLGWYLLSAIAANIIIRDLLDVSM